MHLIQQLEWTTLEHKTLDDASHEEDKSMRFYLVSLETFDNQVPTSSLMHHYYAILPIFFYILLLYYYIQGLHP